MALCSASLNQPQVTPDGFVTEIPWSCEAEKSPERIGCVLGPEFKSLYLLRQCSAALDGLRCSSRREDLKPFESSTDRGEGRAHTEKSAMYARRQRWERRGNKQMLYTSQAGRGRNVLPRAQGGTQPGCQLPFSRVGWGEFTKRRIQNKWAWPH